MTAWSTRLSAGRAAGRSANGRVVVLPRIGHVAMMERPDLVAAEMREFLHGIVRDKVAQPGLATPASGQHGEPPGEPAQAGQRPTRSRGQSWPRPVQPGGAARGPVCLAGRSGFGVR